MQMAPEIIVQSVLRILGIMKRDLPRIEVGLFQKFGVITRSSWRESHSGFMREESVSQIRSRGILWEEA